MATFLVLLVISYEIKKLYPKKGRRRKMKRVRSARKTNVADKKIGGNLLMNRILTTSRLFTPRMYTLKPVIRTARSGGVNVLLPKVCLDSVENKCKEIRIKEKLIELCYVQRENKCNLVTG